MGKILVISAAISYGKDTTFVQQNYPNYKFISVNEKQREASFSPRMLGKIPKMLGWDLFPGYDYYLWIDNKFSIEGNTMIDIMLAHLDNHDIAFFRHPIRRSIRDEASHITHLVKDGNRTLTEKCKGEDLMKQVNHYISTGYIDDILLEGGIFIYSKNLIANKHDNMMKEWFYQTCRWSIRDQLSLPYVLKMFNTDFKVINENIYNKYTNFKG